MKSEISSMKNDRLIDSQVLPIGIHVLLSHDVQIQPNAKSFAPVRITNIFYWLFITCIVACLFNSVLCLFIFLLNYYYYKMDKCDYSHVLHQTIDYNEVVVIIEIMNK